LAEDCLHDLCFAKFIKFLKQSTCLFSSWCWTWSAGFGHFKFRFVSITRLAYKLPSDEILSYV